MIKKQPKRAMEACIFARNNPRKLGFNPKKITSISTHFGLDDRTVRRSAESGNFTSRLPSHTLSAYLRDEVYRGPFKNAFNSRVFFLDLVLKEKQSS